MKRLAIVAVVVLGLPLLGLMLLVAVANTTWGEDQLRDVVVSSVSESIPGDLTIGSVRDISLLSPPGRLTADVWDIEFTTQDRPVIKLEHAQITYSWLALLSGEVLIDEADVHGGTVTVELDPEGALYLVKAFDGPRASSSNPGGSPIGIALQNLRANDLNVLIRLPGRLVQIEEVTGAVDISREEGGKAIVVRLTDVSGVVSKPNILGSKFSLQKTNGTIGGSKPARIDLDVDGEFMSSDVAGSVRYLPNSKPSVEISLKPEGAAARLIANVADLKTMFGENVSIDVQR